MLLYLQSVYVYMAVESLSTIKEAEHPLTCAIATFMLAEMYLYSHHLDFGTKYLKSAYEIVKRRNIKFLMRPSPSDKNKVPPTTVGTQRLFEEIRERVAFLAQLIYIDTDLFLVANQAPTISAELEQEFKFDLPASTMFWNFRSCPHMFSVGIPWYMQNVYYRPAYEKCSARQGGCSAVARI